MNEMKVSFTELKQFLQRYSCTMFNLYAIVKNENDVPIVYENFTTIDQAQERLEKLSLTEPDNDYILIKLLPDKMKKHII